MVSDLPPVSDHLEFLSPLSSERADQLVRFLAAHTRGTVVDIGCGWASLVLRLLEAGDDFRGLGIDLDASAIESAHRMAGERGLADRLQLVTGKAVEALPPSAQGAVCIGATHAWWADQPTDSQPLDYQAALEGLRALVERGSPVVFGEGVWSAEPTDAALKPLGGRRDEFLFLPDLIELARDSGFVVMQVHEASLDEWDAFESGFTAGYGEWLAQHGSDHPSYADVHRRMSDQQAGYFRGYRGVLGFAYLCLLAV